MQDLVEIENPTAGDLSCRALKSLLLHFERCHGQENLRKVISSANLGRGVGLGYLLNENNWVSFNAGQRIIDVLDEFSTDPEFVRKSGLALATKDSMGVVFSVFKSFGGPKACYEHIFRTLHLYNRVGDFKVLRLTSNTLRFSYKSSVIEPNLRFSEFRLSQFASIPTIWGFPPAEARKLRCQVSEENCTESVYELKWKKLSANKVVVPGLLAGVVSVSISSYYTDLLWASMYGIGGVVVGCMLGQILSFRSRLKQQELVMREQTEDLLNSMTEVQARYDEVQVLNISLERKVADRTAELSAANERLQKLDRHKDQFLANISHELRTPLVALSSTLQMLMQPKIKDEAIYDQLLRNSSDAIEDMLENVNDLLLKTRLDKERVDLVCSAIDVGDFLQRALSIFEPVANKKNLKLEFRHNLPETLILYADRAKLKKIFNNLIGNAIKFTSHGQIDVELIVESNHCCVCIKDSGIGIPAGELDAIFSPFFQASNNQQRNVQGIGIGLSLVSDLVSLHQGYIELSSELGVGSEFRVYLPLGDAHVDWRNMDLSAYVDTGESLPINFKEKSFDSVDLISHNTQSRHQANILIVEDNPQIVQVLAYLLRDHYNLHFSENGQNGLHKARELRPQLIISDIMMPVMDGYELIEAIRREYELKNIPVILLTSKTDKLSRLHGFEVGADEYFTKPFNNQEVLLRVDGLIKRKQMEAEFIHLEKMVSLGQLAAGVGHEINNPIAYAKSAADTVEKIFKAVQLGKISLDDGMLRMEGAISRIKEGTMRVAEITEALRGFIRQGSGGYHLYDIHEGIESTLKIIHINHKSSIRFNRRYELTSQVECNLNQFNQVIMNLVQNACHALEQCEDAVIDIHTFSKEDRAYISIRDNGVGIPTDLIGRIFDPFFTTKELGKGTGLGLHICKQVVSEHQGSLVLRNGVMGGVECEIALPLSRKGVVDNVGFTGEHIDRSVEKVYYPHR